VNTWFDDLAMNEPTSNNSSKREVRVGDKELVAEVRTRASAAIVSWLRERPEFIFWHSYEQLAFTDHQWLRFVGYGRRDALDAASVVRVLVRESPFRFQHFEAKWIGETGYYTRLVVTLKPASEWSDVLGEVWQGEQPPPFGLSQPGQKLLQWLQDPRHQDQWVERMTVGRQAGLRGTSWTAELITTHLKEIQRKAAPALKWESRETDFRISLSESSVSGTAPLSSAGPLNPVLPVDVKEVTFAEMERFRVALYDWVLVAELPDDNRELLIWRIDTRATLHRCFSLWEPNRWEISDLTGFLSEVGVEHGLLWGYSFQDPEPWTYVCVPKDGWTWQRVKESIHSSRSGPSLAERYGLSTDAAAVLRWFTTLRPKEWRGAMTPTVEKHLKTRIGIEPDWDAQNFGVFLRMLAEELTEKTEWRVRIEPWRGGYGGDGHRLIVRRKPNEFDTAVHQIQLAALAKGKALPCDQIESTLRKLLG
jgi:hypothetical protein